MPNKDIDECKVSNTCTNGTQDVPEILGTETRPQSGALSWAGVHLVLERSRLGRILPSLSINNRQSIYFDPKEAKIETLTLWVRLPNLPLHFWHEDAILPVVNVVGRFIKLDEKTKNTENYMFARACIEIDLRTPLKRVLVVHEEDEGDLEFNMVSKPVKLYVSYEGIFEVCFECGSHKHKFWECPNKKKDNHFVLVDRAESDNDVEPEELEVDPEIKSLSNKEIMLYFPLPIKTDNHMPEEVAKEDLNPPSPAWTTVQRKNKTMSKAQTPSGIQGGNVSNGDVKAPKKKKANMVQPGISFKDVAASTGAFVVSDEEVRKALHLINSRSPSSNQEESENFVAAKSYGNEGKDMVMTNAGIQSSKGNLAMSGSSEMSTGTESKKRTRILEDDNMLYESAEEEGSISSAAKLAKK
ncbi:hypothetical protein ACLB2K_023696 [Fragaria x ananassa]